MVKEHIVSSEKTNKDNEIHQEEFIQPELRFSEFESSWGIMDLGQVGNTKDAVIAGPFGSNLKVNDYKDEGLPLIRLQNIERSKFINKDIKYVSEQKAEELKHHSFKSGDILFSKLGNPIGKTCRVPKDFGHGIVVADVVRIRPSKEKINYDFLVEVLNSENIKKQIENDTIGSTRTRLNLSQVRNLNFYVPTLKEQNKIADFLSLINKKIELLEKKYQNKIIFKEEFFNNYISNMYDTEQKIKLDKLITISNERNKNDEDIQVLSISNKLGFISQEEQFEDRIVASSDTNNYKIVKKGYFAYNPARINVGSIARLKGYEKGIISPMYIVFKIDENLLNPTFFENYLSTNYFKLEILKRLEGSVRLILSADSLKNIEITVPSLDEQNEISAFLNNLSKNINLTKKELDNFKEFKKGLLQKMFV